MEDQAWHARSVEDTIAALGTDVGGGLSAPEARRRLERHGANVIRTDTGPGRLAILLEQFRDVLIWILLVAAFISGALLGEWIDTFVILAIVVLNAVIGYTQEVRAESALAELREMAAPEAVVIRDGEAMKIKAAEVVPGDVVALEAGDRVPADARLVDLVRLEAEEASLTGESLPVVKDTRPVDPAAGTGDRTCMVFSGTVVSAGRGTAVVVETGATTQMGLIAAMLAEDEPPTPLQVELDRVGRRIGVLALAIAVVIFGLGLLRGNALESMFLTAVALAVAAIPEGLPAVNTITLSRGVQKMADRNAIVRRLPAVEALGAATVICTDKTGTLTKNEMAVQQLGFAGVTVSPGASDAGREARMDYYARIAGLCNDVRRTPTGFVGDPTEVALVHSVDPVIASVDRLRTELPRVDELGFDSRRKRMATLHRAGDGYFLAIKGAPETIIDRSSRVLTRTGVGQLDASEKDRAKAEAADFAARGLRTLAFAYREFEARPDDLATAENDLVLVAIAGMSDEVRPEVPPALEQAQRAGLEVVMVTGDHEVTARSVADRLGMLGERQVMGGATLRATRPEDLGEAVHRYGVYARVDPVDKVKLVKAWQQQDAIVAMTGDGVNDAPALRAADIGVAMGSGTAVAKESSSMVLADDNFATIVAAVGEGRAIFSNLKKVVYFLLSANVSEIVVMLIGFLVFGGLGEPLLAVQILWINLVTDGLPAIALGMDPAVPGLMDRPPDRDRNILGTAHQLRLLWQGSILAAGALGAIVYGHLYVGAEWEYVRTLAFTVLVGVQMVHIYNVRAQGTTVWKVGFGGNRMLTVAVGVSVMLQLAVVYLPVGNRMFDTVPISAVDWPALLILIAVPFFAVDAIKRTVLRRRPASMTARS